MKQMQLQLQLSGPKPLLIAFTKLHRNLNARAGEKSTLRVARRGPKMYTKKDNPDPKKRTKKGRNIVWFKQNPQPHENPPLLEDAHTQ
jgi:hypothetical protein